MQLRDGAWRLPPAKKDLKVPILWKWSSRFTVAAVGLTAKVWFTWLNKTKVYNKNILLNAIDNRRKKQGLLTVSNHNSCIDDPGIQGVLPVKNYFQNITSNMRFCSAAEDVCFTKDIYAIGFSLGQIVPVVRGAGVYQQGMDYMVDCLNLGRWCHHFPEGKIAKDQEYIRFKWGTGRLIADSKITPLVLPIWHVGMDSVLPNKRPYIPLMGQHVTMLIGSPLDFTSELNKLKTLKKSQMEIRKRLTDLVQMEMYILRKKAEQLHFERPIS